MTVMWIDLSDKSVLRQKTQLSFNISYGQLVTALRKAVDNDGVLDEEATSYNDIFDAFRLTMEFYRYEEVLEKGLITITPAFDKLITTILKPLQTLQRHQLMLALALRCHSYQIQHRLLILSDYYWFNS
jgi:hypothetical protein